MINDNKLQKNAQFHQIVNCFEYTYKLIYFRDFYALFKLLIKFHSTFHNNQNISLYIIFFVFLFRWKTIGFCLIRNSELLLEAICSNCVTIRINGKFLFLLFFSEWMLKIVTTDNSLLVYLHKCIKIIAIFCDIIFHLFTRWSVNWSCFVCFSYFLLDSILIFLNESKTKMRTR